MTSFIFSLEDNILDNKIIIGIVLAAFGFVFINYAFKMVEMIYVRKITSKQQFILRQYFSFYSKLTKQQQRYFEHRLALFIKDKDFIGREGLLITDEVKVLVSATAIMLTLGFRDFYIGLINKKKGLDISNPFFTIIQYEALERRVILSRLSHHPSLHSPHHLLLVVDRDDQLKATQPQRL